MEPEAISPPITPTRVSEDWKSSVSEYDDEPEPEVKQCMGVARLARDSLTVAKVPIPTPLHYTKHHQSSIGLRYHTV